MTSITTKLVKDGNSVAVRLPKALLALSGLHGSVEMEAKKGQIIIKQKKQYSRSGWKEEIESLVAEHGDPSDEFKDWQGDDLHDWDKLAWDGPTYEEWLKRNAKG
jgi:antitoxin component of MazEF toxin-antitoxin module